MLVDDASDDATIAVATRLGLPTVRHAINAGYGANQKTCYTEALRAGADIIVMVPIRTINTSRGSSPRSHRWWPLACTTSMAATDGVVVFAGRNGGYGNFVKLSHAGGYATGYGHMSRIAVAYGTRVRKGQVIGFIGSTGISTGPHLHYELYRNGAAINPASVSFSVQTALSPGDMSALKARLGRLMAVPVGRGGGDGHGRGRLSPVRIGYSCIRYGRLRCYGRRAMPLASKRPAGTTEGELPALLRLVRLGRDGHRWLHTRHRDDCGMRDHRSRMCEVASQIATDDSLSASLAPGNSAALAAQAASSVDRCLKEAT